MEDLILSHHDDKPLETMKKTPALLKMIKMVRDGDLNYESKTAMKRITRKLRATGEDVANLVRFFAECQDSFSFNEAAIRPGTN